MPADALVARLRARARSLPLPVSARAWYHPDGMTRGHFVSLDYHRRLLGDAVRVDAYERALRKLVRPGDVVLDLGAGTGLLAMLAARRGARVHAVESTPVADLAAQLVRSNRLHDRVTIHHADVVEMDPAEPVDLVIGDFMGRFVVDDLMYDAVRAARRWLKPDGRFCPMHLRLLLAPIGDVSLPMVDLFEEGLLGLDLRAAIPPALDTCYAAQLGPEALLAPARTAHQMKPPEATLPDCELAFTVERAGRFQGFAGWFEAALCAGIRLDTGPGVPTHWGQYLFPVEPRQVAKGDVIRVRLTARQEPADVVFTWEGTVQSRTTGPDPFAHDSRQRYDKAPPRRAPARPKDARAAVIAANKRGSDALLAGRLSRAVRAFEEGTRALRPDDDDLAAPLYENLGLANFNLERYGAATRAFLRALDGDPGSREQSLRFLVASLAQQGLSAGVWLDVYEKTFGPHPLVQRVSR